jgi:glycosyltransferase involved in cell wall biosynthesis
MRLAVEANAMAGDRRGIGRYARQVLRHAARLRDDLVVTLVAAREEDRAILSAELPELGLAGAHGAVAAPSEVAALRPDLVWLPWPRVRWRVPEARLVATIHDLAPFYLYDRSWFRRLDRWRRRLRLRRTAALADRIITDSIHSQDDIIRRLGVAAQRVTAIPLAADDFTPAAGEPDRTLLRDRFGLAGPYFLYVGAGDRRKNLPRLLEAFHGFRASSAPPAELALCGPRPPRGRPAPGTRWIGRVGDAELRALYHGATALIQPSLLEGFGLPVLEAMASGTPVISSNASSLPEVGGGAALYFAPTDVVALRGAMERCATDAGLRADLRRRGLAQAGQFSWEGTARRTLAVFDAALAEG